MRVGLRQSRELLAYLLLHGPASRAELLTALWPEAGRASVEYFKQALKRLREDLVLLTPDGQTVPSEAGRYRLPGSLRWSAALDLRPVFPNTQLRAGGEAEVGVFLAPFDSAWVEEARPAVHALLAERVIGVGTGGEAADMPRLRRLHHLLPDDARVLAALVSALHQAGATAEAQATQAAHRAALQALGS